MAMSESIDLLAAALVAAQGEFEAVPKDGTNPHFKSKFASLANVVDTIRPILAKHGLAVSQWPSEGDTLVTMLLHSSGQHIAAPMPLHLAKSDPQGMGSALSYARRYSLMAVLGLVSGDEDDDGQAASKSAADAQPVPVDPKVELGLAMKNAAEGGGKAELEDFLAEYGIPKKPSEMSAPDMAKVRQKLAEMASDDGLEPNMGQP